MSFLSESEILRLLFNTFTADGEYLSLYTTSNAIIVKSNGFLTTFYCIFGIYIKFWASSKKAAT